MIYGYRPQGEVPLPEWASRLTNYYWHIRVEGRNKVKRRRYYRLVAREKLRLVEAGLDQELVEAACRYLSRFNHKTGSKLLLLLSQSSPQLKLDFLRID